MTPDAAHGETLARAAAALEGAGDLSRLDVVCLPDFFLDHFVELPPWGAAVESMRRVHDQGGGNVPGHRQRLQPGGNAANTALALARLGVRVGLVARTSPFGRRYLEETLGRAGVDLTHVADDGDLATTTALEFEAAEGRRNVMLNDPGSVAAFGPGDLSERALDRVAECDLALVANWVLNEKAGTELAEVVTQAAKAGGGLTYMDTGDPSSRLQDVGHLFERVVETPHLDVLGVNENELAHYAGEEGGWRERGERLHRRTGGTLDLHTARFTATWSPEGHAVVPTFEVRALRATGAGDAWNAGNILGHLLGLDPAARLAVANAVGALYVSSADGAHPGLEGVASFLGAAPAKKSLE